MYSNATYNSHHTMRRITPLNSPRHGPQRSVSTSALYTPFSAPAHLMQTAFEYPPVPMVHKVTSKYPLNYERTDKVSASLSTYRQNWNSFHYGNLLSFNWRRTNCQTDGRMGQSTRPTICIACSSFNETKSFEVIERRHQEERQILVVWIIWSFEIW